MNAVRMVQHSLIHQARTIYSVCGACEAIVGTWCGPDGVLRWCYTCRAHVVAKPKGEACPYCEGREPTRIERGVAPLDV